MVVGITGKSGVGKTTYANTFFKDFHIINVDSIGHEVMLRPEISKKIAEAFNIDLSKTSRVVLGDLIFNDRHQMKILNDIIWDEMKKEIDKQIHDYENVVIDWILLPHSHFFNMCDIKILIVSDEDKRISYVLKRDNISREYLSIRDKNSIDYNKDDFDYIIFNNYCFKKDY